MTCSRNTTSADRYGPLIAPTTNSPRHPRSPLGRLCLVVAVLSVALSATGTAHAQETVGSDPVFGLRPADVDLHESGYFAYYLEPGEAVTDYVTILNDGEMTVTVRLYLAGANTAIGGSASFGAQGDENDTTAWISANLDDLTLEPGERRTLPFTVSVPAGTRSGDYTVGMVTELVSSENDEQDREEGQSFLLEVVTRVAVAVVVTVEGERTPGLEVLDIVLVDQSELGARFFLTVQNTGNVMLQGRGTITVSDPNLGPLADFPFTMDTVLAGDTAGYYITGPLVLGDGEYQLSGNVETAALRGATPEEPGLVPAGSAEFTGVQFTVIDGGPPPEEPKPTVPPRNAALIPIASSVEADEPGGGLPLPALIGGGALLVLLGGALFLRRGKKAAPVVDSDA